MQSGCVGTRYCSVVVIGGVSAIGRSSFQMSRSVLYLSAAENWTINITVVQPRSAHAETREPSALDSIQVHHLRHAVENIDRKSEMAAGSEPEHVRPR